MPVCGSPTCGCTWRGFRVPETKRDATRSREAVDAPAERDGSGGDARTRRDGGDAPARQERAAPASAKNAKSEQRGGDGQTAEGAGSSPAGGAPDGGPTRLSPESLRRAFAFATDWLGVYVEEVNALNVYPVPDGDTGTNMHLTMQSVRRQLHDEQPRTMAELAHALSYGSLLGARGNSGVILSQILKGFAEVVRRSREIGGDEMVAALKTASKTAYAAVMKPVEGTILTVVREAADAAERKGSKLPLGVLRDAYAAGEDALARTPEQLPMLAQAGVVDAGGLGFLRIVEGVIACYERRDLPPKPTITKRAQTQFESEEYGYCTEFLLADVKVATREIQELVAPYGDSLLVVGAEGYVKGHIHTQDPERLLADVARHGRMVRSKVEDMSEQHSEILADAELGEAEVPPTALVTVADGTGITRAFRSLGARVVGGGQTANPSVQDIADVVRSVGAEHVIVMPNNKNILMAAERVAELVPRKTVHVLPTRTMGQGLAAAVMFNERADVEELLSEMEEVAEGAVTLEVTTASRTATIEDVSVVEGEYIGLIDNELEEAADDPAACLLALVERVAEDVELGALFYSAEVGEKRAKAVLAEIDERHPDLEIELHSGAPDLYPFVLTLE